MPWARRAPTRCAWRALSCTAEAKCVWRALAWVLAAPAVSLPGACRFQHPHHFAEAALPCKLQRRVALAVGQRLARTRPQQGLQGGLVARAAVAQHDGLDERRPVQVVHMVERRASG